MNQLVTQGIILSRINYGEADRIITLLTPDHGKLRLMAKGVRRAKSKLAGGIELFSVSSITFIQGRGDIGTLVSTRLNTHYGAIVSYLDRVQLGYELLKQLDKATEDEAEPEYFGIMQESFVALNEPAVPAELIQTWFTAQLLRQGGLSPNLQRDSSGDKLQADKNYSFDLEKMAFTPSNGGRYTSSHIKLLRLLFSSATPRQLSGIRDLHRVLPQCRELIISFQQQYSL